MVPSMLDLTVRYIAVRRGLLWVLVAFLHDTIWRRLKGICDIFLRRRDITLSLLRAVLFQEVCFVLTLRRVVVELDTGSALVKFMWPMKCLFILP